MPETRRSRIGGWQIACGKVPKHWQYRETLSKFANEALYFCRDRMKNKDIVLKVYIGYRSYRYTGKCYTRVGVICLDERRRGWNSDIVHTLAHEVAHMAYASHGPRHQEITEKIYKYFEDKPLGVPSNPKTKWPDENMKLEEVK